MRDDILALLAARRGNPNRPKRLRLEAGWIIWKGGPCPVPSFVDVFIRMRDSFEDTGPERANTLYWNHQGNCGDIVAYKVVEKSLAKGWITWYGGECPEEDNTQVYYRLRSGEERGPYAAGRPRWFHMGNQYDIVAYRVA